MDTSQFIDLIVRKHQECSNVYEHAETTTTAVTGVLLSLSRIMTPEDATFLLKIREELLVELNHYKNANTTEI